MNAGLWGGLGRGLLFVLQVALQRRSDGFASGEFAGRVQVLLLLSGAQITFPMVAFGLEFRSASSLPVTVCTTGAALGSVLLQSEGTAEANPLLAVPLPYSYFVSVPSSKYGFVKFMMWATFCHLRCLSQIKPWLSGLVLLLNAVPYGVMF